MLSLPLLIATLFVAPAKPVAHFALTVSPTSDGYRMVCQEGCGWKSLSFTCAANCRVLIHDTGVNMDPNAAKPAEATFAFTFERHADQLTVRSLGGTQWDELDWNCTLLRCDARLDQNGVKTPAI